ncbi:hypothetical protein TSUD_228150 [Trifolium subterraneum]|uniref:Uncharacterized protein n=1 Tax=Trifolium subterraneum TaxID=3900 RepID=A0A2Z6MRF1_TRISU|nr:hypothetical protein TSUD_228150 [Trifolium subterraneum]
MSHQNQLRRLKFNNKGCLPCWIDQKLQLSARSSRKGCSSRSANSIPNPIYKSFPSSIFSDFFQFNQTSLLLTLVSFTVSESRKTSN